MRRPSALVRRLDQLDAVRRLGPGWLAARLQHEYKVRSGALRRGTPVEAGYPAESRPARVLVDSEALRVWLQTHVDDDRRAALHEHHHELRSRRFLVFGTRYEVTDWHVDPVTNGRFSPELHWSDIREIPGVDLKCVWEPSRFGWAFDLARLHLLDPEAGAFETFWKLFESWLESNPPNAGVNWNCGQESSIRMLAVTLAVEAMHDRMDESKWAQFGGFVSATANRVASHISYAKSQRNNHLASEAMGLLLAANLLPDAPASPAWSAASADAYADVMTNLVFPDGGSSQYSTNYHRVFVHTLAVKALLERMRPHADSPLEAALRRSGRYLTALMVDSTGAGSFHGHDDGADILPLSALGHRNLAASVDLLSGVLGTPASGVTAASEAAAWFGLTPSAVVHETNRDRVERFPDAGIHVVRRGATTAILRAGPARYRPAHADQLNVEIWHAGRSVTVDRGTAAYTSERGAVDDFSRSDHHSTVVFEDGDHMPRVGRFLWSRWVGGRLVEVDDSTDTAEMTARAVLGPGKRTVQRRVLVGDGHVEIYDEVRGEAWASHWQLAEDSPLELEPEPTDRVASGTARAVSYRQLVSDTRTVVREPTGSHARSVFRVAGTA